MGQIFFLLLLVKKISSSYDRISFQFSTSSPTFTHVSTSYGNFTTVHLPNSGTTSEIGKPLLPVFREFIRIPICGKVGIQVKLGKIRSMILPYKIYPKQPPHWKIPKYQPKFEWNKKTYTQDKNYPQIGAKIEEIVKIRGVKFAVVKITPVSYNPYRDEIQYVKEMKITLTLTSPRWEKTFKEEEKYFTPVFQTRWNLGVNYKRRRRIPYTRNLKYLIITPQSWLSILTKLIEWKKQKGYEVTVASLAEIGNNKEEILTYIQEQYNSPSPPVFILLVGDTDSLAPWDNYPVTDLNYSLLDGEDYFPDVDLGRLSVRNEKELKVVIDKIVKYEQTLCENGWYNFMYFIASNDPEFHRVPEETHLHCMNYLRKFEVKCDSLWLYYNSGTLVEKAINEGRSWIIYSGHGNPGGWQDFNPDWSVLQVYMLKNSCKIPFVMSFACKCGKYDEEECFQEAWLRKEGGGGILHLAASESSSWEEDDIFQKAIFKAMGDSGYEWVMGMINMGKMKLYQHYGGTGLVRLYFEMYNLIGDPGIEVYWGNPSDLIVEYPKIITPFVDSMRVKVKAKGVPKEDVLVCVKGEEGVKGYTDEGGEVWLKLKHLKPGTLFVTATGSNLKTYQGICEVVMKSLYFRYYEYITSDSIGDGDSLPEPGEVVKLKIAIWNGGKDTVKKVVGELISLDYYVEVKDSVKTYTQILPNGVKFSMGNYLIKIKKNTPPLHIAKLGIKLKVENEMIYDTFNFYLKTPILRIVDEMITEEEGNKDGYINKQEKIKLKLTIKNVGNAPGYKVKGVLKIKDPYVELIDSVKELTPFLPPNQAISISSFYKFYTKGSLPSSHFLKFFISFSDSFSHCWVDSFTLPAGEPFLKYEAYQIEDNLSKTLSYNRCWECGEEVRLGVKITNLGIVGAKGVISLLSTEEEGVKIFYNKAKWEIIPPGGGSWAGEKWRVFLEDGVNCFKEVKFKMKIMIDSLLHTEEKFKVHTGVYQGICGEHDVGKLHLTITPQGILGITEFPHGIGNGLHYPPEEENCLSVGGVWLGVSREYVVNRDYGKEEDWQVVEKPNGYLTIEETPMKEEGYALYSDSGHPTPKGVRVMQKSWAWGDTLREDFIIIEYRIQNKSLLPISNFYFGNFMDFTFRKTKKEEEEKLIFQYEDKDSTVVGVQLLFPLEKCVNITGFEPSKYIKDGEIPDPVKFNLLTGKITSTNTEKEGDWASLISAGPFTLKSNEEIKVVFGIVGGENLVEFYQNAEKMKKVYKEMNINREKEIYPIISISPNPLIGNNKLRIKIKTLKGGKLVVYDIIGRKLTQVLIPKSNSPFLLVWPTEGEKLVSGVYFLKWEENNTQLKEVKKLIVIK